MENLLEILPKPDSQYIDDKGKLRAFCYSDHNTIVYVFPSAPLDDIKRVEVLPNYGLPSFGKVSGLLAPILIPFYKQLSADPKKINGIVFGKSEPKTQLESYFVPIKETPSERISLKTSPSALRFIVPKESKELLTFRRNKKIAGLLMIYSFYLYLYYLKHSHENYTSDTDDDPEKQAWIYFKKGFVIDPDHSPVLRNLSSYPSITEPELFRDQKLIVDTKETKLKLIEYVKTLILKTHIDSLTILSIRITTYEIPDDFVSRDGEIIFSDFESLKRWVQNYGKEKDQISSEIRDDIKPFYFKNSNLFGGKVCIVQNTYSGNLEEAIKVSVVWLKNHINIGASPDVIDVDYSDDSYIVYDLNGETVETKGNSNGLRGIVVKYVSVSKSTKEKDKKPALPKYAAILPLVPI